MRGSKMLSLGWKPKRTLPDDIEGIVKWYRDNLHLYRADFEPLVIRARSGASEVNPQRMRRPVRTVALPAVQARN
jgi:hypothetical protein